MADFVDFDDAHNYAIYLEEAIGADAKNFVVKVGFHGAEIAVDVDAEALRELLESESDPSKPVRWINLWGVGGNEGLMGILKQRYGFSNRLVQTLGLMGTINAATSSRDPGADVSRVSDRARQSVPSMDPEDFELLKLLQRTINFFSVDHGDKFICVGANWLDMDPQRSNPTDSSSSRTRQKAHERKRLVPPHHWSTYILTTDHIIISIQTDGSYESSVLREIRKNTTNLLSQLSSKGVESYERKLLAKKGVRSDAPSTTSMNGHAPESPTAPQASTELPSKLFYYLIEDYGTAIAVMNQAKEKVDDLTQNILHIDNDISQRDRDKTQDQVVKRLSTLSKELRQLRSLFESYEKLIQEICKLADTAAPGVSPMGDRARSVRINQSAHDRFERLSLRLKLLVMNPIDEYLSDIQSLSGSYFNLIAQKDSMATARLTRNATLLAKLSVLFAPISLLTSYFSIQIPGLFDAFTTQTYWVSFAVVAAISFLCLFLVTTPLFNLLHKLRNWQDRKLEEVAEGVTEMKSRSESFVGSWHSKTLETELTERRPTDADTV